MTLSARSVNVDHRSRTAQAVRTKGELDMGKFLLVVSGTGEYPPETDPRYKPSGRTGGADDIERQVGLPVAGPEGSGGRNPSSFPTLPNIIL